MDVFTMRNGEGVGRPVKLNELEERKYDADVSDALLRVKALFSSASASKTPVLWRLLLAQASLMHVLIDLVDRDDATIIRVLPVGIEDFARSGNAPDFEAEILAVDTYLRAKLARAGLAISGP